MTTLKVEKDGRLRLPKRLVGAAGLTVGEVVDAHDLELRRRGIHRRAFLRWFPVAALGTAAAGLANIEDVLAFKDRIRKLLDPEVDPRAFGRLFGVGPTKSAAMVLAANHPFSSPPSGRPWYPIEEECAGAYMQRFAPDVVLRKVPWHPRHQSADSAIVFGSQVSNLFTRDILGNPWDREPVLHALGPRWSTKLHWNLHSPPDAPRSERRQFGGRWVTTEHQIVSDAGTSVKCRQDGQDDYLLITALPCVGGQPQRTLIFAGIHAAGTLAAEQLLREPPGALLRDIDKAVKAEPYYQALLRVDVGRNREGEARVRRIALVDAQALDVTIRS